MDTLNRNFFNYVFSIILLYFFILFELTAAQQSRIDPRNRTRPRPAVECAEHQYPCWNGQCVDTVKICDGEHDCLDDTDEIFCETLLEVKCALPPQTADKSYAINCRKGVSEYNTRSTDKKVNYLSTLTFTCNPGYTRPNGNNIFHSVCLTNWTPAIPDCLRICQRLFPTDLDLECYRNDTRVNCYEPLLSGTKVRATCKYQYKPEKKRNYEEIVCDKNGQWSNPLPECVFECGKLEGNDTSLMLPGSFNNYNHFPWHVAIYDVRKPPELICSGTIISPVVVLTAATCVYDKKTKNRLNSRDLELVVAKVTPNYFIQDNEFQKTYQVQDIFIGDGNLALIEVHEKIAFSYGVIPACIGLKSNDSEKGRIASWGLMNEKNIDDNSYRIDEYGSKDYEDCTTEEDKFCGHLIYGIGTNISDVGAGYIYKHTDNLYYVLGVVNIKYRSKHSFTVINTKVYYYYFTWLEPTASRVNDKRLVDASYKTRTDCEYDSSTNIKQQKASICSLRNKVNWAVPPCKRTCSKLQLKNVNRFCTYNNLTIDCGSELVEGTKVKVECIKGYKPEQQTKYQHIECQENGEWSNKLFDCIPDNTRSCLLPEQTKDKSYTVDCNSNLAPSDRYVEELTMLAFQCAPGYYYRETAPTPTSYLCKPGQYYQEKINNFQVICINGTWTPEINKCTKLCKTLLALNIKPDCYFNGEKVDCKGPLLAGTHMRPLCNLNYRKKYKIPFEELVCDENGDWDGIPIECVPTCGANSFIDCIPHYEDIAFHVSIIDKKQNSPICAGTLISPYLVLTNAGCFYNSVTKSLGKANNYEVVVGKKMKPLPSTLNQNVFKFTNHRKTYKVKNIYFTNKERNKIVANYLEDLAIVESVDKIELNENTIPACVNWHQSSEFNLKPYFSHTGNNSKAKEGKLIIYNSDNYGSNKTNTESHISYLHYPYDTCKRFSPHNNQQIKNDLFCLFVTPRLKNLNSSDLGAGYLQERGVFVYYVQGVYSTKTSNDSYLQMIDVNYHANWLKRISDWVEKLRTSEELKKIFRLDLFYNVENPGCDDVLANLRFGSETKFSTSCTGNKINRHFSNGCYLPNKQEYSIDYIKQTCPPNIYEDYCSRVQENGSVPELTKLDYRCKDGYANGLDGDNKFVSFCYEKWQPGILQCKKYCKKLRPVNVLLTCLYNGQKVSCDGHLVQNTVVTPKCLPEYEPEYDPGYREITCLEDGEWSDTLFRCKPICGRPAVKKLTPLIKGGREALFGEFPWHVAIYNKALNNTLICGGSILSPYVIISAAHCFFDQFSKGTKSAGDYLIAVGKISRDFSKKDSEVTVFYEIENIIIENFLGITLRYQYDIAILQTKNKIEFNPQVIPICLRYAPQHIRSGELLNVCGWGVDDTDTYSTLLRVAALPYLSISECIKKAPDHLIDYVSTDKFCVANVNGSIVDRGDSGGGLSLLDNSTKLHYLVGIVSFKAVDLPTVAIITDVHQNFYLDWITRRMSEVHAKKQYEI